MCIRQSSLHRSLHIQLLKSLIIGLASLAILSSFIPISCKPWTSLPASIFPTSYNLALFQRKVLRHLSLTFGKFFWPVRGLVNQWAFYFHYFCCSWPAFPPYLKKIHHDCTLTFTPHPNMVGFVFLGVSSVTLISFIRQE